MRFIDFHTHVFPDKIAAKATANICSFYDFENDFIGNTQTLLDLGGQAGVTHFLILPVSLKPEQTRHINEFAVREMREHPEFISFGALHPDMEDLYGELDFIEQNGLRGVKIHPDMIRVAVDDPRMLPIYDAIQDRMPIMLHCGDYRMDYSAPQRLRKIMRQFPRLQVFGAHLGGWSVFQDAVDFLADTDIMVDMSSCTTFLPPEQIVRYIRAYGADRVLFGTDFPLWRPMQEVENFLRLPLTDTEKEKIAYRNAEAVLDIR